MAYDFDKIARTYDRLNRVMTLGLDRRWRKRAAHEVVSGQWPVASVLDVACGTGDMAVSLAERGCTVTGVDLSEEMLAIARHKLAGSDKPLHQSKLWSPSPNLGEELDSISRSTSDLGEALVSSRCVSRSSPETGEEDRHEVVGEGYGLRVADAENLPFVDESFDGVTCAFGVRNFVHLEQGLAEMLRVLKPGGLMVILELSTPDNPLVRPFYNLYTRHIIPLLGKMLAGNREAYTYLPDSIAHFPKGDGFIRLVNNLEHRPAVPVEQRKLTFGVCRLYVFQKVKFS